ncbi:MAG: hypothetical protein IJ889_01035 [Eubacterium sp.]|nr:hypothetical protein [Eubacterium sp.]MBR2247351.1 hypothetical protein [Bacilli bacterium]
MDINERTVRPGYTKVRLEETAENTRCGHNVEAAFNIIDTRINPMNDDDLGIINSEIFDMCHSIVDTVITICDWSNHAMDESLEMVSNYIFMNFAHSDKMRGRHVNWDTVAVFFIVDKESNFNWQNMGVACSHGYMTADHILDFSGNFVMVKTSLTKFKEMNAKYVMREQNVRRFKYNAEEDCYEERK